MGHLKHAKLLVVGGTGFIGRHLIKQAKDKGWKVTSLSLTPPSSSNAEPGVAYLVGNIENKTDLERKISDQAFDYVVNLSGYINHSPFFEEGNAIICQHFLGVINLMAAIDRGRLRKFVQIGSSDEYGCISAPQKETDMGRPVTPYAFGKNTATKFLQTLYQVESTPVTILRLFLTYGPGQDNRRFIPQLIKGCLADIEFPVSEGNQIRDFCYVEDVVRGILLALEARTCEGEIINLASGSPTKLKDVISLVQQIAGGGSPLIGALPYRVNEAMELYADISKARDLLLWNPATTMEEGLKKTIDRMRTG